MIRFRSLAGALGAAALVTSTVFAQVPADPANPNETLPEKATFMPYGDPIKLADARKAADAALADAEKRGIQENILFLAGSAINSLKRPDGTAAAQLGIDAMQQAIGVHESGELREVPAEEHLKALAAVAKRRGLAELSEALRQRYPGARLG